MTAPAITFPETPLIVQAREFATRTHARQSYGGQPYTTHLDAVAAILRRHGYVSDAVIAAGYLHDALEDHPACREELERVFPADVYNAVCFCTDEPGPNRRTRKQLTYARMAREIRRWLMDPKSAPWTPDAIRVKVADRFANVAACKATDDRRIEMYRREHPEFYRTLYVDGVCKGRMWDDLRWNLFG